MLAMLFWGSAACLVYTYFGYPLVIGVLSRLRPRPWTPAPITPTVTLVIAAWNEAGVIEAKLRNALELDYPPEKLRILVASDGSSDDTVAIARRFEARGVEVLDLPRGGKTETLNRALVGVDSELVVFSDANVFFEPDALHKLVRHFADPQIGGVSGDVRLKPDGFSLGDSQGFYYRYERFLQRCESKLGSIIGADGGMYAIRRAYFRSVPPELINDDFIISMEVVKQGGRLIYDPEAVAWEDSPVDAANEFKRKSRVEHGNFQAFFSGWSVPGLNRPGLLASYLSHKALRWFGFAPLGTALLSSLALAGSGGIYAMAATGQAAFYTLALIGWQRDGQGGRLSNIAYYFTLENLAAVKGIQRLFTGQVSWGTARTRTRST